MFLIYLSLIFSILQGPIPSEPYQLARFAYAEQHGTIGLLAHSYMSAGQAIASMQIGDTVSLVYPDRVEIYIVSEILRYTALDPLNPYGNLSNENGIVTADALAKQIYASGHPLVLQTCYDNFNGRLFVILKHTKFGVRVR